MSLKKGDPAKLARRELKRMLQFREGQKHALRARLAARDEAYAASPCAAKVTVEVRGRRVIETRGQSCIAPRVTHLGN